MKIQSPKLFRNLLLRFFFSFHLRFSGLSSFFRLFSLSLTSFIAAEEKYNSAFVNSVWLFSIYSSFIAFWSSLNWTITVDFILKAVKTCTTYRTYTFIRFGWEMPKELITIRSGRRKWRSCIKIIQFNWLWNIKFID